MDFPSSINNHLIKTSIKTGLNSLNNSQMSTFEHRQFYSVLNFFQSVPNI